MCWLQNTSHHLSCPAYTVLGDPGNWLLYQGKLMFLWSFYIHILKNRQSSWPCVWVSFAEGRKANEKEKSWAWPQLWKLLHTGRSFHFYRTVPSFWLSWAICPWPVLSGAQVDIKKSQAFRCWWHFPLGCFSIGLSLNPAQNCEFSWSSPKPSFSFCWARSNCLFPLATLCVISQVLGAMMFLPTGGKCEPRS